MKRLISLARTEIWVPAGPRWFDAVALFAMIWGFGSVLQAPQLEASAVFGIFVALWPVLDRLKRWAREQNYGAAGETITILYATGCGLTTLSLCWLVVLLFR